MTGAMTGLWGQIPEFNDPLRQQTAPSPCPLGFPHLVFTGKKNVLNQRRVFRCTGSNLPAKQLSSVQKPRSFF